MSLFRVISFCSPISHCHFRGVCILPGRQIPDGCKHSQFHWNYNQSPSMSDLPQCQLAWYRRIILRRRACLAQVPRPKDLAFQAQPGLATRNTGPYGQDSTFADTAGPGRGVTISGCFTGRLRFGPRGSRDGEIGFNKPDRWTTPLVQFCGPDDKERSTVNQLDPGSGPPPAPPRDVSSPPPEPPLCSL